LQPIRASDNGDPAQLVGAKGGFLSAKRQRPKIIMCSWGGDGEFPRLGDPNEEELAFAAEIRDGIEQKIFMAFSAGNGQFSVEPQVEGVSLQEE
jgi:hypothetical protein